MEEKALDMEYYKAELERTIRDLQAARNEIEYLQKENAELVDELNKMSHEDEVIITTKHPIDTIDISFKK